MSFLSPLNGAQGLRGQMPSAFPVANVPSPQQVPQIDLSNFNAAHKDLGMTPQEQNLYQLHLKNLAAGGVPNPDGGKSTLYQAVVPGPGGKFYNVPTVWDGKIQTEKWKDPKTGKVFDVPNATALQRIQQMGWDKFPSYDTPQAADERYSKMHKYIEKDLVGK